MVYTKGRLLDVEMRYSWPVSGRGPKVGALTFLLFIVNLWVSGNDVQVCVFQFSIVCICEHYTQVNDSIN